MRMDKGAILASMAIIVVASVFAGAGTMAWFSTEPVTTDYATFTAGTMSMEGVQAGPFNSPPNWAPGDIWTIEIKLKNTGNIDIKYLAGNLILYGSTAFADNIEVTSILEYIPGYGWVESMEPPQDYWNLVKDYAKPLTLLELAKSYYGEEPNYPEPYKVDQFGGWVKSLSDWVTGWGYDIVPEGTPAIAVGGTYQMKLMFKFSENAGNEFQGATCSFKITFVGIQDMSQVP